MKYCSHQHKNPDDALFCHECGEKLTEDVKGKRCPNCKESNPMEAKFCFNCGSKLDVVTEPPAQEFYNLKVRSQKECGKIWVSGSSINPPVSWKSEAEFKIPKSDPVVDIIIESYGKTYKYEVDCRTTTSIYIPWGSIEFTSNYPCDEVKIDGANMPSPKVLTNVKEKNLAFFTLPAGTYSVEASLDGQKRIERVVVESSSTKKVNMNFIKEYTLTIISDEDMTLIEIDKEEYNISRSLDRRKLTVKRKEGIVEIFVAVRDRQHKALGVYREKINLNHDEKINLKWCKLELNTNAIGAKTLQCIGADEPQITSENNYFLCRKDCKYELTLIKPNKESVKIYVDVPNQYVVKINYVWKEVKLIFSYSRYKGYDCCFSLQEIGNSGTLNTIVKTREIPPSKEVVYWLREDSEYRVESGIDNKNFHLTSNYFKVNSKTDSFFCNFDTVDIRIVKWKWLRYSVFYGWWGFCLFTILTIVLGSTYHLEHYSCFKDESELKISSIILLISILGSYICTPIFMNKKFWWTLTAIIYALACISIGITISQVKDGPWYMLGSVTFGYAIYLCTYLIYYKLKIMGFSIWDTIINKK